MNIVKNYPHPVHDVSETYIRGEKKKELLVKNLLTKATPNPCGFTGKFYQKFKKFYQALKK